MIDITNVEHSSMESPGSEGNQQVNKCLLNFYYTPGSSELNICSPLNILIL